LAKGGEGDTAVEGSGPLLFQDEIESMGSVAVFGNVERVGHRMLLGLQPNLYDLHRAHDRHGFGSTRTQTSF
jgi:hypothetical protein